MRALRALRVLLRTLTRHPLCMRCRALSGPPGFNPNCEFRLRNEAGVFEVFARNNIAAGARAAAANAMRGRASDSRAFVVQAMRRASATART